MTKWLDINALADYLGVPKSTLYKLKERGELPSYKVGRRLLFDAAEVDDHIKASIRRPPERVAKGRRDVRKSKAS